MEGIDKTIIGKVLKPQGIKGEVKVMPLTNDLDMLAGIKAVYIGGVGAGSADGEPAAVKHCSVRGGYAYILLAGIDTRNGAELLRGKELYISKADVRLKKGAYYVKDVIGCQLLDSDGAVLGVIAQIENFGAADVYTAENEGRVFRFPFIKALKPKVNLESKTVTVDKKIFEEMCVYED